MAAPAEPERLLDGLSIERVNPSAYLAIKRCREFRNQRNHGGCSSLEAESERDDRDAMGVVAQYNMFDCAVGQFHKFGASRQVIICATGGKNHKNTREKLDEPLANTKAMQEEGPIGLHGVAGMIAVPARWRLSSACII
jgi:hypothetical protein